jgi:hypothetical protein
LGLAPESLGSILQINDYDNAFGKMTDMLSDRSTLAAGYLFTDVRNGNTAAASPGQGLPSSYRDSCIHDQTAYGNLFHLFNSRLASESSVAVGRRIFWMDPVGAGFEPAIDVADTLYSGGFLGGVDFYTEHHFQSREALTYTHDSNSIKIGAEFEPIWFSAQTSIPPLPFSSNFRSGLPSGSFPMLTRSRPISKLKMNSATDGT